MGLEEGLQLAQWLLNLNRQGQIDRENKAYQDRIIQQQDEQRRQEMATNDAISAMLAGSGEANDMFTQLPSLQNQAKILGTLQATGGMFGGPFSMMGDASRAAYNAASEGVSSFAQNPVLSLARLGLEKGGSPIDVAKYAQAISGMDSPINRYQAEQAARAKDDKELDTFRKKEDYTYGKKMALAEAEQSGRERVAMINAERRGEGGSDGLLSTEGVPGYKVATGFENAVYDAIKDLNTFMGEAGKSESGVLGSSDSDTTGRDTALEKTKRIDTAFGRNFAYKKLTKPGPLDVDAQEYLKEYYQLPQGNWGGKSAPPRKALLTKALEKAITSGDMDGASKLVSAQAEDAKNAFLSGSSIFPYSVRTRSKEMSDYWARTGDKIEVAAIGEGLAIMNKIASDLAKKAEAEKRKPQQKKKNPVSTINDAITTVLTTVANKLAGKKSR